MTPATRKAISFSIALATMTTVATMTAPAASADAQTCITGNGADGQVCTQVHGDKTFVEGITSKRILHKLPSSDQPIPSVCNYSAWFYYVPPSGGAHDLGYRKRAGCTPGAAYFDLRVDREFPADTLICSKWHEDDFETFIAEKCVGLTGEKKRKK